MEDSANFANLVKAIRPWLPHIVIVGGWAHRLHRFHPLATTQEYQPRRTRDVDLAFAPRAPLAGDLKKALAKEGFDEELSGESTPPVTHYTLGKEELGFYAEFLTVLKGDGSRRDGQRDLTMAKAGITAQKLRHLELLLIAPWKINIGPANGIPVDPPLEALVPNPVSLLVQKFLFTVAEIPTRRRKMFCTFMTRWSCSVARSRSYALYGKMKCVRTCRGEQPTLR